MNISHQVEGVIIERKVIKITKPFGGLNIPTMVEVVVVEAVLSEHAIEPSRFVVECEHKRCYIGHRVPLGTNLDILDVDADPREEMKICGEARLCDFRWEVVGPETNCQICHCLIRGVQL